MLDGYGIFIFNTVLIIVLVILNLSLSNFIDGTCVVALAQTKMTTRGFIFQPFATMLSVSNWYMLTFY